jgi:hypothetical protein
LVEKSESAIGQVLVKPFLENVHKGLQDKDGYRVHPTHLRTLRFHFEALRLIQAVGRTEEFGISGFKRDYVVWNITEKGRKYISTLWAVKRPAG